MTAQDRAEGLGGDVGHRPSPASKPHSELVDDVREALLRIKQRTEGPDPYVNGLYRDAIDALARLVEQLQSAQQEASDMRHAAAGMSADVTRLGEQYQAALDALREASLHQGLPEDAPPDRIAAHFRGNREFAGGFRKFAGLPYSEQPFAGEPYQDSKLDPAEERGETQ